MRRVLAVWLLAVLGLPHSFPADFLVPIKTVRELFRGETATIRLPLPDGSTDLFQVEPTGVLPADHPYPIATLRGYAQRNDRSVSLVITPDSVAAQVFQAADVSYLNSRKIDGDTLVLESGSGGGRLDTDYQCLTAPGELSAQGSGELKQQSVGAAPVLRTFRLAAGATAEFTEYHGSREAAVREVVTAMTRASEIFRRELGITLELVPGFERMVFSDRNSDPFSSNEPDENLLKETQSAFDSVIGNENYDVGIVLTRGNYGLAYIRSVCDPLRKGSSCIGLPEPAGDVFHVNLVTHELGHQFGANHTFNSPTGLCSERRNEWAAFEPGAGSTIMSYSSLPCGDDSFQPRHDAYFHSESLKEIQDYVSSPAVACAITTPRENLPPTVSAGGEYTIPVGTPFTLTASAQDVEGHQIFYCWEERDLGPAQTLGAPDNGLSPRFRSLPPSESPARVFPRLEQLLTGSDSPEERLPQTNRLLRFRVVARNSHGDGAIAWADTQLRVTNIAGPFRVTSHRVAETMRDVTRVEWSTGGTERAPISAGQVRITLSTNGGVSFPIVLSGSTANDGEEEVVLPPINAGDARLKVEPVNNVFFDINDAPLTIASSPTGELRLEVARRAGGQLVVSWASVSGTAYRLERAGALPPSRWSGVLSTNAPGSEVSVVLSASADAAYYRVIEE